MEENYLFALFLTNDNLLSARACCQLLVNGGTDVCCVSSVCRAKHFATWLRPRVLQCQLIPLLFSIVIFWLSEQCGMNSSRDVPKAESDVRGLFPVVSSRGLCRCGSACGRGVCPAPPALWAAGGPRPRVPSRCPSPSWMGPAGLGPRVFRWMSSLRAPSHTRALGVFKEIKTFPTFFVSHTLCNCATFLDHFSSFPLLLLSDSHLVRHRNVKTAFALKNTV